MLKNYLLIALRNFRKHKAYTLINIFGLALGIATCCLILLWVQDELNFDHHHKNLDQLYGVILNVEGEWWGGCGWALAPIMKKDYPEVEKATRYTERTRLLKYNDKNFYEEGAFVDPDFLDMFSHEFIQGDPQTALTLTNSIILTEELAIKYFPNEDPLGKVIILNNNNSLTVSGVIKNIPHNSTLQYNFLAPVKLFGEDVLSSWSVESESFLLLNEKTDVEIFNKKVSDIVMKYDTRTDRKNSILIHPLKKFHLYSLTGTGAILYVVLFSIIAVLILLIACVNFMNLATARASSRAKEIGMRKTSGAGKMSIILQFFGESTLLAFIAMILALILIQLFMPTFNSLSDKELSFKIGHSFGLIIITLMTGLISGSYPAFILSSFNPSTVLKQSNKTSHSNSNLRKILVISQFTAAIILILSTLVIQKQLQYIKNKNLGLNKEHVITLSLNESLSGNYSAFKNEILANPNIVHVTNASSIPTSIGSMNPCYWEGQTSADYRSVNWVAVDYDYFETFEMEFLEGRSFSKNFSTDRRSYVINEEAAKLMNFDSVVGKKFSIWSNEGPILGVVKNFHSKSLHSELSPIVFTMDHRWDWSLSNVFIKIKPDNISETIHYLQKTTQKFAPEYPFEYSFMDDHFDQSYKTDQRIGSIFKYFSMIAILISCLGLMGLAAFMIERRTKEIGIRKVMGASKSYLMILVSKEFITLIVISNLIASPLAYILMSKLLNNYAYKTEMSLWLFISTALFTVLLTLITIGLQIIKIIQTDPVKALKYE